jgi:ATP-binding protein involved in chromosome partitioning
MSEHVCEACGHHTPLYRGNGTPGLEQEIDLPIWANVPFDPALAASTDAGRPWVLEAPEAAASRALCTLAAKLVSERLAGSPELRAPGAPGAQGGG